MSTPSGPIPLTAREWPDEKTKPASFPPRLLERAVKPGNAGIVAHRLRRFAQLPQDLQLRMALTNPVGVIGFALGIRLSSEHRDVRASNKIDILPRKQL